MSSHLCRKLDETSRTLLAQQPIVAAKNLLLFREKKKVKWIERSVAYTSSLEV